MFLLCPLQRSPTRKQATNCEHRRRPSTHRDCHGKSISRRMSCSDELVALLSRLGLERHVEQFEEEAITELSLLRSMGAEMLRENLTELGMEPEAIAVLSAALFPEASEEADDDEGGLTLEDNEHGGAAERDTEAAAILAVGRRAPGHNLTEPNAPDDRQVEELEAQQADIEAAATDVDWLNKPLAVLDPPEAKRRFLETRDEAHGYFRRGLYANAAAAYTRALDLQVPNEKANASLLYNRAGCRRHLGQLHQAMQDAQLAAKADPTLVGAWWRAADAALALGGGGAAAEAAAEAVAAGLKLEPRSAPLLELRRRVEAAA